MSDEFEKEGFRIATVMDGADELTMMQGGLLAQRITQALREVDRQARIEELKSILKNNQASPVSACLDDAAAFDIQNRLKELGEK